MNWTEAIILVAGGWVEDQNFQNFVKADGRSFQRRDAVWDTEL